MMRTITGQVVCLQVGEDFGFTTIRDATDNVTETLCLWFLPGLVTDFTRVLQSMWVSLLRESMTSGVPVTIDLPDDSSLVASVALGNT